MKSMKAATNATIITTIFIVVVTILAELSSGFKDFLAKLAGHHWTAKSLLSIIVFFLSYSLSNKDEGDVKKMARNVVVATVLGGLLIFFFYIYEFAK